MSYSVDHIAELEIYIEKFLFRAFSVDKDLKNICVSTFISPLHFPFCNCILLLLLNYSSYLFTFNDTLNSLQKYILTQSSEQQLDPSITSTTPSSGA